MKILLQRSQPVLGDWEVAESADWPVLSSAPIAALNVQGAIFSGYDTCGVIPRLKTTSTITED